MRVVWSEPALDQFDEILAFIAHDNPTAATAVGKRIRATAALLGRSPRIGRATDREGLFALTMARYPYVIFYRIIDREGTVRIVRIRHARRRS
jgi:toxin ParE1/3/4